MYPTPERLLLMFSRRSVAVITTFIAVFPMVGSVAVAAKKVSPAFDCQFTEPFISIYVGADSSWITNNTTGRLEPIRLLSFSIK